MTLKDCFDFSNTRFSFRKPLTDYSKIQIYLISPILRNNPLQKNTQNLKGKEYLNVGCGHNISRDFINLDYFWRPGIDLCWDLRRKIPLPDKSIKGIYCEHCLEHISIDDCLNVLIDFKRLLKKSGIIRIIVPDGELYLDLYNKNKSGQKSHFPYSTNNDNQTPMMHVNRVFYEYGHQYIYDAETLSKLLKEAGFLDIERKSFMNGQDRKLLIDTEHRSIESLYMEASS
jgi:predicted SAM-dependent methyltransferase